MFLVYVITPLPEKPQEHPNPTSRRKQLRNKTEES